MNDKAQGMVQVTRSRRYRLTRQGGCIPGLAGIPSTGNEVFAHLKTI